VGRGGGYLSSTAACGSGLSWEPPEAKAQRAVGEEARGGDRSEGTTLLTRHPPHPLPGLALFPNARLVIREEQEIPGDKMLLGAVVFLQSPFPRLAFPCAASGFWNFLRWWWLSCQPSLRPGLEAEDVGS